MPYVLIVGPCYTHALPGIFACTSHERPRRPSKGLPIIDVYMANIPNGSTSSDTLTGEYTRHGGKLSGPVDLLMVHRTTTTAAKVNTFVLRVHHTGRREYVSSLWDGPTPGTYALEYKGLRYTVTLTDTTAVVTPAVTTS